MSPLTGRALLLENAFYLLNQSRQSGMDGPLKISIQEISSLYNMLEIDIPASQFIHAMQVLDAVIMDYVEKKRNGNARLSGSTNKHTSR